MELEQMEDKALFDALHKAGLVEKLTSSEEWKMLKEAGDRIVARAVNEFMVTPASDTLKIMELQVILRKYKKGIFQEVEMLKNESDRIYEEAKDRGMIGDLYETVKERFFK